MTYEAELEVLEPEAEPAPVPEVAAFVVPAAAVVEVPLLPVEAPVVPAAVVEAPLEAALVSPFKQLLLAGETFQKESGNRGSL